MSINQRIAAANPIRLPILHRVPQPLRKYLGPAAGGTNSGITAVHFAGQGSWPKVALTLGGGRHVNDACFGALHLSCSLIIREPEQFVPPERPSDGIAELIASQFGLGGREEIGGIQLVVAQELEYISMDSVGARLGDGVQHRSAEFSVFGVEAVGDKTKFLDGVKIRHQPGAQVAALAYIASVHKKRVCRFALAVD